MNSIKLRIAAKTDVGLVRDNNEDNFQVSSDLTIEPMRWVNNEVCSLGNKGMLLVVADGMGGMNAGEVASEIAINTVRECFSSNEITDEIVKTRFTIEKFMNSVIVEADRRIKADAKEHPESRGMGTTIVIAWLFDGKLYVSWCGDSRAYIYNPQAGLHQITKDHSYVQSLVDKGRISKEDAFDYPESNIITRCLSDSSTKAKPESLLQPYDVCDKDIILLCTDGLSGMIRDKEIENIIRANEHNMDECSDELIRAACEAEGADNITICMCQILQGAGKCNPSVFEKYDQQLTGSVTGLPQLIDNKSIKDKRTDTRRVNVIAGFMVVLLLLGLVFGFMYLIGYFSPKSDVVMNNDNVIVENKTKEKPQKLQDVNGMEFYLERKKGDPQVNDKAYPDGEYILDNIRVVVKDSTIISVEKYETKNATDKVDEKLDKNNNIKTKSKGEAKQKNNVLEGIRMDGGKDEVPNDNTEESEKLTPVGTQYVESIYKVKKGESLYLIARKHGLTTEELSKMNNDIKAIHPGDTLVIRWKIK